GLIFLPYVMGERAPVWDADAKGVFFGIHSKHTQAHFMRAIIEGISFALFQVTKSLEETVGPVTNIYASGGFIHSKEWLQILADILGMKIHVTNATDASALGAAILGFTAIGVLNNLSDAKSFISVQETYFPNEEQHRIYMGNYAVYASLYFKLKEEFLKLETLHTFGQISIS
ncbi:MAG: FGGY-family carbohydrate kinase, partial [Flavitalea sp.]